MSNNPNVNLTVGLNLTTLKRDLGILSTSITKTETEIRDKTAQIAVAQAKIINGVTTLQQASLNKQIANMTAFVNIMTQKLNVLQGKQQQYYSAITNYAQNAAKAQNAAGGGGGGRGGGLMGSGASSLGRALISGGFALRGVPGLGAVSSLGIGAGFGGAPGVAGAVVGLGIAEAAAGITKLIGLYSDLSKAAFDLWEHHDQLKNTFDQTSQTVAEHFYPALKAIQEEEVKIADWFNENQDKVGVFVDQLAQMAISGDKFVQSLLLFVTQSPNISTALQKVGGIATIAAANISAKLNFWSALITNPTDVVATPIRNGIQRAIFGSNPTPPENQPGVNMDTYRESIQFAMGKLNIAEQQLKDKDLKSREQIEKLTQTIQKRKEEVTVLQETLRLTDVIAGLENDRETGIIGQVKALRETLYIKETIAELEVNAKKKDEADALEFLKTRNTTIEKKQADEKYQEAIQARLKAEESFKNQQIANAKEISNAEIKEQERVNTAIEKIQKESQHRTLEVITRKGPVNLFAGQPGGEYGLTQRQAVLRRSQLEGNIGYQQSLIAVAQQQFDSGEGSVGDRKAQLSGIEALKKRESEYNDELIKTIQLLMLMNGDPTSDAYKNLEAGLNKAIEGTTKLQKVTLSTGDMLRSTFEIIIQHASAFNNVIGNAAGRAAILGKSVLDLSKINIGDSDKPAGSILGGLKEGFSTKAKAFTQGIPEVAAIASAAIGLITSLHDLFTHAAKAMAQAISKEVDGIVSSTKDSGKIAQGLAELELERLKAIDQLATKKGGQKQLETLLPDIKKQMDELKKQQAEISDTFNDTLEKLKIGAPFDAIFDNIHSAQKQIKEFINSVGDANSEVVKVQEFLDLTYAKMSTDWQKRWDDSWKAWGQGAENAAGELISIDKEAVDAIDKENSDYDKSETKRTKDLADLKKNYAKQQADDLKKLGKLQQDLIDLNDQETKDILSIQNEGIQERQKTTEDDKRQRIADLQDATSKQRQGITDQINDIEDVRAERAISYNEAIQQATDEETQAELNHQNTISRIINETDRKRAAFLENLENLKKEKAFIDDMQQGSTEWLNGFIEAYKQLPAGGVFVDQITINLSNPNLTPDEISRAIRDGLDNVAQRIPLT